MIYRNLHTSILRFCADFAETAPAEVVNFDAASDENSLPKADCIGPMALSFELDDHLVSGTVQIGFSTWDDTNLFRLVEQIDALLELLKPTCRIKLYDSTNTTDEDQGFLVIENGTRVMPVVQGELRPIQFIAVRFSSTKTFGLYAGS